MREVIATKSQKGAVQGSLGSERIMETFENSSLFLSGGHTPAQMLSDDTNGVRWDQKCH